MTMCISAFSAYAQKPLTPEQLWGLGRVSAVSIVPNATEVLYSVRNVNIKDESSTTTYQFVDVNTGKTYTTELLNDKRFVQWDNNGLYAMGKDGTLYLSKDKGTSWKALAQGLGDAEEIKIAPNGKHIAYTKHVLVNKVLGTDLYKDTDKSTAQVYTDLNYRHWDTWYDGKSSHLFIAPIEDITQAIDLLENQPFDVPTKPHGSGEDFLWSPNSEQILYVCKKKFGKAYAESTNTDIYAYNLKEAKTYNLTEGMLGYDVAPAFSPDGKSIAWLSMKRDGFEADKNDVIVFDFKNGIKRYLTQHWNETVDGGFIWSHKSDKIFFNANVKGTMQLFDVLTSPNRALHTVRQITQGQHDIAGIVGQVGDNIVVSKTDMNTAAELYKVNIKDGAIKPLSTANAKAYEQIAKSDVRMRMVKTTDGKEMGVWVIYPPDFDSTKKYPTILYCQGGPQSAVSQFYSVRWNFQLMAANGYIVVAPNRRGLPGWGTEWNEAISKDWGGQSMKDYLAAIDDVSKESYVDKNRIGAVGASYGGYSVFMLAGIHDNRFKSFIAHCGLFDMKSWYGTTEEMWFANWDLGGNYWDNPNNKSYTEFNPSEHIAKWNTPMLIIQGGMDFRVPTEQGLQAFKAAQTKGIKSKLLYFPNENHWVLHAHNGLVWQREFFGWLQETLKDI